MVFCIFTFESLVKQCKCNATWGFPLISRGIKSLCSFTVILIYVNVSVFVYKVFFVNYFLCKASPQISKNSILWIISPDYMHSMSDVILQQLLQVFSSSLKFLAIIKSWQQSLFFLENVLSINHSRCGFLVLMSNPSFIDILQ